jgi:hypothetical protein
MSGCQGPKHENFTSLKALLDKYFKYFLVSNAPDDFLLDFLFSPTSALNNDRFSRVFFGRQDAKGM